MPLMIAQTKQYANVKLVLAASHSKAPMMIIVMFLLQMNGGVNSSLTCFKNRHFVIILFCRQEMIMGHLQIVTPLLEKRNKNVSYDVPFIRFKMDLQETHITRLRHRRVMYFLKRGH